AGELSLEHLVRPVHPNRSELAPGSDTTERQRRGRRVHPCFGSHLKPPCSRDNTHAMSLEPARAHVVRRCDARYIRLPTLVTSRARQSDAYGPSRRRSSASSGAIGSGPASRSAASTSAIALARYSASASARTTIPSMSSLAGGSSLAAITHSRGAGASRTSSSASSSGVRSVILSLFLLQGYSRWR